MPIPGLKSDLTCSPKRMIPALKTPSGTLLPGTPHIFGIFRLLAQMDPKEEWGMAKWGPQGCHDSGISEAFTSMGIRASKDSAAGGAVFGSSLRGD